MLVDVKVLTKNGNKNIKDIGVGESVLSFNEINKKNEYCKVIDVLKRKDNIIYEIKIENEVVKVSIEHPFYNGKEYVEARLLKKGDKVLKENGLYSIIDGINIYEVEEETYNIEIEKNHNYYIGENEVLVHNPYGGGSSGGGGGNSGGGDYGGSSDDDGDDWRAKRIAEIEAELAQKEAERREYAKAEQEIRASYEKYSEGLESLKAGLSGAGGGDDIVNATASRINDVVQAHTSTVSAINQIDGEINALHSELNGLGCASSAPVRDTISSLAEAIGVTNNNSGSLKYDRSNYNQAIMLFEQANTHFNAGLDILHGASNSQGRVGTTINKTYSDLDTLTSRLRRVQDIIEQTDSDLNKTVNSGLKPNAGNVSALKYVTDLTPYYNHGKFTVTTGNKTYEMTDEQKLVFASIVAAEMGENYGPNDALAICSVVLNRCEMENWQTTGGNDPYAQITFGGADHKYEFEAYYKRDHEKYIEGAITGNWDLREANPEKFAIAYKAMEDALHGVRNTLDFTEYHAPEGPNWNSDYHSIPNGNNFYTNPYDKRIEFGNPIAVPLSSNVEISNGSIVASTLESRNNDFNSNVISVSSINGYNGSELNSNGSNLESLNSNFKTDVDSTRTLPNNEDLLHFSPITDGIQAKNNSELNYQSSNVQGLSQTTNNNMPKIEDKLGATSQSFRESVANARPSVNDPNNWAPSYMGGNQPISPVSVVLNNSKQQVAGDIKIEDKLSTSYKKTNSRPSVTDPNNWAPSYMGGNQPASPARAQVENSTVSLNSAVNASNDISSYTRPAFEIKKDKSSTNNIPSNNQYYNPNYQAQDRNNQYYNPNYQAQDRNNQYYNPNYNPYSSPYQSPTSGNLNENVTGVIKPKDDIQTKPETVVPEKQPETVVPETQPETVAPETQPETIVPETQPETVVPETQPETIVPETQPETTPVNTKPGTNSYKPGTNYYTRPKSTIKEELSYNFPVDGEVDVPYNNVTSNINTNTNPVQEVIEEPSIVPSFVPPITPYKSSSSNAAKIIGGIAAVGAVAGGAYVAKKAYDSSNIGKTEEEEYVDDYVLIDKEEENSEKQEQEENKMVDENGLPIRQDTIIADEDEIL